VLVVLAIHAAVTYGGRAAWRLIVPIAVLSLLKEISGGVGDYTFLLTGFRVGQIPVPAVGGWLVASLLALDFAHRATARLPGKWRGHLPIVLVLVDLFAWHLSNAIEPIAQVAGWWRWNGEEAGPEFPRLAPGPWAVLIHWYVALTLIWIGCRGRRVRAAAICLGAFLLVPLANTVIPNAGAGIAILAIAVASLRLPGLHLDPAYVPLPPRNRAAALARPLPLVCLAVVLATLWVYANAGPRPDLVRYLWPVAVLSCVPELVPLARRMRPATPARSDLDSGSPIALEPGFAAGAAASSASSPPPS